MKAWWSDTAWPWVRENALALFTAWWADLGEHPGLHFLSMAFGAAFCVVLGLFL